MLNRLHDVPGRKSSEVCLERVSEGLDTKLDEDRESSESPFVSDIGSPYGSSESSQYGGCMDFGDADENLI